MTKKIGFQLKSDHFFDSALDDSTNGYTYMYKCIVTSFVFWLLIGYYVNVMPTN